MSSLGDRLAAARRARADERVEADADAGQEWRPDGTPPAEPDGLVQASPYVRLPTARLPRPPAAPVVGKRRADVPSEFDPRRDPPGAPQARRSPGRRKHPAPVAARRG